MSYLFFLAAPRLYNSAQENWLQHQLAISARSGPGGSPLAAARARVQAKQTPDGLVRNQHAGGQRGFVPPFLLSPKPWCQTSLFAGVSCLEGPHEGRAALTWGPALGTGQEERLVGCFLQPLRCRSIKSAPQPTRGDKPSAVPPHLPAWT